MQVRHNISEQALNSLEGFVNREEELRMAREFLKPSTRTWLVVVYGIGGIGKTAFALKVASTAVDERFFDIVVWSTAKSKRFDPRRAALVPNTPSFPQFRRRPLESLDQLLRDILKLFNISNKRGWSIDNRLDEIHDLLARRRALIIVDDFEMLDQGASEDILEFVGRNLPEPTKALVTSRRRLGVPGEASIVLHELTLAQSEELIQARAERWNIRIGRNLTKKDIERLWMATNGHPLAIELAIGQLRRVSLQTILDSAVDQGKGFETYQDFQDFLFKTAFSQSDEDAQRIWLCLAATGEPCSEEKLSQLVHLPLHLVRESIDWLDSNGLISRREGCVSLHPLAVYFGRRILTTEETLPREIEEQLEAIYAQSQSEQY